MVMKERDEELALFLEMRRRGKEKSNFLLPLNTDDQIAPLGTNGGGSPISKIVSSVPIRKTAAENFLNSENENDKSDYDWLLTPPGTPLFPSLEMETQKAKMNQMEMPNTRPTALKTRLANVQEEPASRGNVVSKNPTLPSKVNSSSTGDSRPSSSGGRTSSGRAPTPTGRPTLTTTAKPRPSTPTSRATMLSSKPAAAAVRSSTPTRSTARSLTPTARTTVTASKPAPRSATPTPKSTARSATPTSKSTARSATPTSKSTARSATPTSRPSVRSSTPNSRPTIRSVTPTRQPSAPSGAPSAAAAPGRSSSVSKSSSTTVKSSVPSRGTSPTVKSRPWKPTEMPGFSLDAPPNLRTSLPERPASASRGRPGARSAQSPSVEARSNGRSRQQSFSPSRVRTSNGTANGNGSCIPFVRRANALDSDDVNPVVIGTKLVERVVNMRKLAPPKQDNHSTHTNSAGKSSSSLDSSGFGRSLSKKSLDMALRHMDLRRSINSGSLRPLMTNIPASSMYSVRSGSTKSKTISVTDSPLATSSNCSSEPSVNNNSFILDGSELEDSHYFGSEIGISSPVSQHSHHGR